MKKVGVIAEYNPFHNGHLYHLNKVKQMYPDSTLILILIGNFTQRADASVINKWDKTSLALKYGYDLVIELPYLFATSSAEYYADGAIQILNILKCDYLVFGSETNDINLFKTLALLTKNNNDYDMKVKKYLNAGNNYPKSCSLALKDISNIIIDKPNDVLGLEYVKNIIKYNSSIIPVSIKRTNDYNDDLISNNITSATSIRKNINNIDLIKSTLPKDSLELINEINYNEYFKLIKYEAISNDNLNDYLDVEEGLENKLKKEIFNCNNLNDLVARLKSKRYSYNKIKRMLLHIICNTNKNYSKNIKYIRVLGMSNNGKKILRDIKDIDIPIITKFKKEHECLLESDIKASKIYSLIADYDYKNEFRSSIIKRS